MDHNTSKPGATGQPLDNEDRMLRLGLISSDLSFVPANAFSLAEVEKQTPPHWISVWEESLTTPEQAYAMATNKSRRLVIRLPVEKIRGIRLGAADDQPLLEVVWDRLEHVWDEDGNLKPDAPAGSAGHCGISGLNISGKIRRKKLRRRLAERASCWILTDQDN